MRHWGYQTTQERLLRVNDLDLDKALDIFRATETSQEQLPSTESHGVASEASLDVARRPKNPTTPKSQSAAPCSSCDRSHGY